MNASDAAFCRACSGFLDWVDDAEPAVDPGPAGPGVEVASRPGPAVRSPDGGTGPSEDATATRPFATAAEQPARSEALPHPRSPFDLTTVRSQPPGSQPSAKSAEDPDGTQGADTGSGQVGNPTAVTARALATSRRLAAAQNRPDLVAQLDSARTRLHRPTVTVAMVGEFKQGKSTLVNALLQTAVCPVDADVVTVVPTTIRYGDVSAAIAHFAPRPGEEGEIVREAALDSIEQLVSESGNPGNSQHLRSLEVLLPHRMLRSGLCVVDTPGVGGLESAHGLVTLGVLDQVDGIVFVTDASAELSRPELGFLKSALDRCPRAVCAMTKTDLYPHWRKIARLNEDHLRAAGIDIPVIPVSSFLRLRTRMRPDLMEESGFRHLVTFLAGEVVALAHNDNAASVAQEVEFAAKQLEQSVHAQQAVLVGPTAAAAVVKELETARRQAENLASPTATWQQLLGDGVQDLVADVQYDLQKRLRSVLSQVEDLIDQADPKDSWDEIEEWLRRRAVTAAIESYDLLKARAVELAEYVGEQFQLEAGEQLTVAAGLRPPSGLDLLKLAPAEALKVPGGRLGAMLMATRTAVLVPMAVFSIASSMIGAAVIVPISLALAGGLGQKLIRDERKRQLLQRQQQARIAARKFVEEVSFIMNKETHDALRRTQRQLRDDFQQRAVTAHRSSVNALDAATRASRLVGAEKDHRAAELHELSRALTGVAASVTGPQVTGQRIGAIR